MSELTRRVLAAVVAAPIAIAAIWWGDAFLTTLLAIMAAVGAWEFYRLASQSGTRPLVPLGVVLSPLVPLAVHAHYLGVMRYPLALVPLLAIAVLAVSIWWCGVQGHPLAAVSATVFGVLYTGGTLSFAYVLRYHNYAVGPTAGALMVVFPLFLTWASDIGAYFTGRLVGGPRLMPSVSPGKTISGAVGGLLFTVVAAWAMMHWWLTPYAQLAFTPRGLLLVGVLTSAVAQTGDLAESLLKREAGVKDSGVFFPGHGGVLDRLDSLFFVLPVMYFLYSWLLVPVPVIVR